MKKIIDNLYILIIIAAVVLAVFSFWDDSIIVDEVPHIGAGYGYLKKADYRLNPEHPPLAKDLAALPLLFSNLNQDAFDTKFWQDDINGQWDFGRFLIFQSDNNADLMTRIVKFPILIFFVLSALLIFKWTDKLYGRTASLIALILFAFSSTVIAHSRFVTTDIAALFGVLVGTFYFIRYLKNPTKKNLLLAGILFGVAQLTKFSVILLAPFFLTLIIGWGIAKNLKFTAIFKKILATILIFIIGYLFIVWPIYLHHTWNYPTERQKFDTEFLLTTFGNRTLAETVVWMSDKPAIRALGQYGLGLLMVGQRSAGGNTTFFLGEVSNKGWKHYFPIVYFLKEPLAWWIMVAAVLFYLSAGVKKIKGVKRYLFNAKNWIDKHFEEFAFLLFIIIYWGVTFRSNLNIGVRHLLPIYPFTIMLISGKLGEIIKEKKNKLWLIIIPALIGWYVVENIRVWPHYLSYFNQAAGGPSGGHRYVVDSNLDWGQDLKRLSQWVEENNIDKIHLDYFGWADPEYYLGDKRIWLWAGKYTSTEEFLTKNPEGGYVAISMTFFMGSRENPETSYTWLESYEPVANIGNSIWVWEIRELSRNEI